MTDRDNKLNELTNKQTVLDSELRKYRYKVQQLEEEKLKLQDALREIELATNLERLNEMAEHKDVILKFMDHDRTSCSDEDPCNGIFDPAHTYRCRKCALMEILENPDYYQDYKVDLNVEITHI